MTSASATILNNASANSISGIVRQNMGKTQDAIKQISTGSRLISVGTDPASAAIYNKSLTNIAVLQQAVRNASQGAGLTNVTDTNTQKLLDMIKSGLVLATEMNNDALTHSERQMAQVMFFAYFGNPDDKTDQGAFMEVVDRSRWNDLKLFEGGVAKWKPDAANAVMQAPIIAPLATTFLPIDPKLCGGIFSGQVSNVVVNPNAVTNTNFDMAFKVGKDTFKLDNHPPFVAADVLRFQCAETGSQIALTVAATPALGTDALIKSALEKIFGITDNVPVVLSTPNYTTGATSMVGAGMTLELDPALTSPGVYSAYVAHTASPGAAADLRLFVTNGANPFTSAAIPGIANDCGNGIKVNFAVAPVVALENFVFTVTNNKDLQFQTSSQSTDITIVSLPKITKDFLHLTDMKIEDVASAADAATKLTYALNQMNAVRAQLGAAQSSIEIAKDSTESLIENLKNAASTFNDADFIDALCDLVSARILTNVSINILPKAFEATQTLSEAIKLV